ncbi:MAG: nicotinamidase [Spirochaetaceae bacterium]|jgi:nicotinamidase/pyrazinamidase|nr:nicotinamidase [Spirochaetaceae bacterium]
MNIDYTKTALLEVDIQNDFCPAYIGKNNTKYPAGALAVADGDKVIDPLNTLAKKIRPMGAKVLATQDWHPENHISFAASHGDKKAGDFIILPVSEKAVTGFTKQFPALTDPIPGAMQQILWPVHCLQNSPGAAFHERLDTSLIDFVFRKGYRKNIDSYSAFFENDRCTPTDLYGYLSGHGIRALIIGGLALDYCVFFSVIDALRLGFETHVIMETCAGIDVPAGSVERAVNTMKEKGAVFNSIGDFA